MPDKSLDEQISDATLVLKGYREALQAVKVNGTSIAGKYLLINLLYSLLHSISSCSIGTIDVKLKKFIFLNLSFFELWKITSQRLL
jgi:ACR3 family arsenite efflux pump ArsB